MKLAIILETNEPEKAWNAVRFANAALDRVHEVKLFLMSAGVEVESIADEKFNARDQFHAFVARDGAVLACGTCIRGRNQPDSEACPLSTMVDCVEMVEWADKVVSF
jgi:sulfur relay (sulfurtransferase) complex TusBCD TusD component (DsrE family)